MPSAFGIDDITPAKRAVQKSLWHEIGKEAPGIKSVLLLAGPEPGAEVSFARSAFSGAEISVIDCDPAMKPSLLLSGADKKYQGRLEHLRQSFGAIHADLCGSLRGVQTRTTIEASARLAKSFLVVTIVYGFDRHRQMGFDALVRKSVLAETERKLLRDLPWGIADRLLEVRELVGIAWFLRRIYTYRGSWNERSPMMTVVFARSAGCPWNPFYIPRGRSGSLTMPTLSDKSSG